MQPHIASFINAILLIVLPLWGYLSSDTPSFTALIPTVIGVLLLICTLGVKKENKAIAHVAVLLTLLAFFGLFKPFMGALDREDAAATVRVAIMLISSVLALVFFVKSFIDARKNRG
jgi:hypothetical protein